MPREHPHAALTGLMIACFVVLVAFSSIPSATAQSQDYQVRFLLEDSAELNMLMQAEDTIEWTVRVIDGGEIYLDFHSHNQGQVVEHERYDSTRVESETFTAPEERTYSLYLVNRGDEDVTVEMEVSGEFEVESENNIEPLEANGSPAAGAILVLSATIALGAWSQKRRSR